MSRIETTLRLARRAVLATAAATLLPLAQAADVVKFGVFPSSAALPFYVAQNRGYFKEVGLQVEEVPMNSHPLTVQALVAGSIDGAANLVTLEGANMEVRRPDTLRFISLSGQSASHPVEQFVVRSASGVTSLAQLKGGVKLFSAPGPANIGAARAVLKKIGLVEGKDFTIQEQPVNMHLSLLQAGTFEGGYTLEPAASVMIGQKAGRRLETGVIATHLIGRRDASAFAAGAVLSQRFIAGRPDVARRFVQAWDKALRAVLADSSTRGYLIAGMKVPPELAASVPLPRMVMAKDLSATDLSDFQRFLDIGTELGVVKQRIEARSLVQAF